jgi:hypothetical protein
MQVVTWHMWRLFVAPAGFVFEAASSGDVDHIRFMATLLIMTVRRTAVLDGIAFAGCSSRGEGSIRNEC